MEEVVVARVLQDFLTLAEGELSIKKGDIVQVLRKIDRHWCYGCSAGKFGNFPTGNLMEIDTPSIEDGQELFVALANFHSQQAGDLAFSKGDLIVGIHQVDDNWWQGIIEERIGIFPVTYTWILNSANMKARRKSNSLDLKALVKMDMAAKLEDEMDLHKGEIVTITEIIDKNWYRGLCGNRSGTFPSAYVQLIDNPDAISQATPDNNTSNTPETPPLIVFSPVKENKPKQMPISHSVDLSDVFSDDYFRLNMPTMYQQESVAKPVMESKYESKDFGVVQEEKHDSNHNNTRCDVQTSVKVDIVSYGLTLYPFYAQFENELSFHEGEIVNLIRHVDSFWIEGKIDERKGIFPTNYINILVDCDERPCAELEPHSLPEVLAPNSFAKVLYNFDAQMNSDLTVRENQVVLVLNQIDDDWCKVKDQSGNDGLCPRNHLTSHSIPEERLDDSNKEVRPTGDDQHVVVKNSNSAVRFQRSKSISIGKTDHPFSSRKLNRQSHSPSSSALVRPLRRQGSDRMPHRPAPPTPVPGQQPVRRILTRPAFNDTLPCATVVEEKSETGEQLCPSECAEVMKEDQRKKNREQRQNVISELVFTEKEYVRDLKITYETFNLYNPSMLESRGIDVKSVFGNILEVMQLAEDLLDCLLFAMKGKDDEDQCVGPCFLQKADEMKRVYGQYCMNHDNALTLLEKYETNQNIQNVFEKGLETLRYQIACFNMGSILIKPVQRILKYPLILNELIKCTEDCHKDKCTLLEAVKCVTEVATSINEGKRRQDIVSKYLEDGNTTIAGKMSRISLHSVAKKSSRLGVMLTSSLGFGNATKDPIFDEHENMFHAMEKSVSGFIQNVDLFLNYQREEVMMQMDIAECIGNFYQEANIAVDQFVKIQRLITTNFWPHFRNMVDTRVIAPLNTLLELFHGPSILVQKRHDKLLDYIGCIAKAEKNKENRLIQDELYSAKNNYEALNTHLLEELPSLIQLATELFVECLGAFVTARKLLSGKITKQYLSLMEMPVMTQCQGDPLESFAVKHSLVLNQMSRFTFSSKTLKSDTLGKRASKTSPVPTPRNSYCEPNNVPVSLQSNSQRAYLQSRYAANMLYQVTDPHVAREQHELTVTAGHLVAVIKKQNPMGDSTVWFVDDGAIQGFLPKACLGAIYGGEVEAPPSASDNTTPKSSRNQVRRSVSPSHAAQLPPSYEEVVNNTDGNTNVYAEIPEIVSRPLYAEIPDSPPQAQFYYAMFDFDGIGPHSLCVSCGQVVNVLQKQDLQGNNEWWLVEDRFGVKGYVPGNFLAL